MSTCNVPPGERIAFWRELVSTSIAPMEVHSDDEVDFHAAMRIIDLGVIQLATFRTASVGVYRTPTLIRKSDPEIYQLAFSFSGTGVISQDRRTREIRPDEFTIYDLSRPFQARHVGSPRNVPLGAVITVQIPHAVLPITANNVRQLYAARLSGRQGIGALLSHHLRKLAHDADQYHPADISHLGAITLDLITATLMHHLGIRPSVSPNAQQPIIYARVKAFIDLHLSNPALSPRMIADAHHMSLRSLHRLFQNTNETVAGCIRRRRLESCRHDLADPRHYTRSISAIAARRGFSDNAHFSRIFTTTFGVSPSAYRRLSQKTLPTNPHHRMA